MSMNDLTAPLGHEPKRQQRTIEIPVAKIIAVALGLFFGAFVLWAMIAQDRSGGEPVAVAPADLRLAKKAPEVIAVPQVAPADATPATTATLPPPAPPKSANTVTITIIDAKTGAKREVQVNAPSKPATAERTQLDQTAPPDQPPKKR